MLTKAWIHCYGLTTFLTSTTVNEMSCRVHDNSLTFSLSSYIKNRRQKYRAISGFGILCKLDLHAFILFHRVEHDSNDLLITLAYTHELTFRVFVRCHHLETIQIIFSSIYLILLSDYYVQLCGTKID